MSTKRIEVRFYETSLGNEPVREWLKALSPEDRHRIGTDIKMVEYGWPIGMPTCRPMGHGLYEVRTHLSGGKAARVLFCVFESKMLLLHGFIKTTQKTPKQDIDLALERKSRMEERT